MKTALIVIDMVKDFVTGKLGFKGALKIIPNIQGLLAAARAKKMPVIYMCDSHSPDDPEMAVWGEHSMANTEGSQVVPELKPEKGEPVLPKHTYNIFFKTKLDQHLKKIGAKELVLVGVVTDICIQNSAAGAFFNGYKIIVPSDCVASPEVKVNEYALDYMKRIFGAIIRNSSEIIREWEK